MNPEHDSLYLRFEQLEQMLEDLKKNIPDCEWWRAIEALQLTRLIRDQVLK